MADIWTLYERSYGSVPSARLEELRDLERKHSAEQLEEAFGKARDANDREGAPFGYVETVLAKMGTASSGQTDPTRLRCERCRLSKFTDNMTTRRNYSRIYGICSPCAEAFDREGPQMMPTGMKAKDIRLTPTARFVEAYWEGVTA